MANIAQAKSAGSVSLIVPPIACSFPWRDHPHALQLKQLSDAWVVKHFQNLRAACKGEHAARNFSPFVLVESAMHLVVTSFFANAISADLLWPIVKLLSWTIMLDNLLDDPIEAGADCAHADRLVQSIILAVLEDEATTRQAYCKNASLAQHKTSAAGADAATEPISNIDHHEQLLVDTGKDWWQELQVFMSPSLQARFCALFIAYLHANCSQVRFREALEIPDVATYFSIRAGSIGWYPLAVLMEVSIGIELGEEAATHPLVVELQRTVCEHIILVNDITSFGREYQEGNIFNVIFLLCFEELQLTQFPAKNWQALLTPEVLQAGVRKVSDMIKDRDKQCMHIIKEIQNCPILMANHGMHMYLDGFGNNLAGNVYWHLTSKRYDLWVPRTADGHPDLHAPFHVQLPPPLS